MALLLMPGMPGGLVADLQRLQYISSNSSLWRLGWLPWQLSALSDVFLAVAFASLPKLSFGAKLTIIIFTLLAVIPDQWGQFLWTFEAPKLAQVSLASSSVQSFINFEQPIYMMVCGWASLFYTVLAVAWTYGLKSADLLTQRLWRFSWLIWSISFACSVLFLLSSVLRVPFALIAVANAVFFSSLMFWFCWVLERILVVSRASGEWGRNAPWVVPSGIPLSTLFQFVGGSFFLRRIFEVLPPISLASEIDGVIYVNYLLKADSVLPMVPPHLELQRLGPNGEFALFSVLTFRHRNFGPQFIGGLRKLCLTGAVSNWRIHVREPKSKLDGIYFLTNITDNPIMAIGARLFSEGMPMHIARSFDIAIDGRHKSIAIQPGDGSAPDLLLQLDQSTTPELPESWKSCFNSYLEFLEYCVPQQRAITTQIFLNRITFQEIRLDIPLDKCEPLQGMVSSQVAERIAGSSEPFCFSAPNLNFRFDREHYKTFD